MRLRMIIFLFVAITSMTSCTPINFTSPVPQRYQEFFELPLEEQNKEFRTKPYDEQIELYLTGVSLHPPLLHFAYLLAENGINIIPALTTSLARESDEGNKQAIIYVFEVMSQSYHVNLSDRTDIISLIEGSISSMKEPINIKRSIKSLNIITRSN